MIDYDQPPIKLNDQQIKDINALTKHGMKDYWKMYDYISKNVPMDADRKMWFDKAAEINKNDFSAPSNQYIRTATRSGFQYDKQPPQDIQVISNHIGREVYKDITDKNKQAVPTLGAIIRNDAGTAISQDKMTLGGWGGSFYYWDAKVKDPAHPGKLATIGEIISRDPAELEKFLAVNAKATAVTKQAYDREDDRTSNVFTELTQLQPGLMIVNRMDGVATLANANLPLEYKLKITSRAANGQYGGSPNQVDGFYRSDAGVWSGTAPPKETFGLMQVVPATAEQSKKFEVIHDIRSQHKGRLDDKPVTSQQADKHAELNGRADVNPTFAAAAAALNKSGIKLVSRDNQSTAEEIAVKLTANDIKGHDVQPKDKYIPPNAADLAARASMALA